MFACWCHGASLVLCRNMGVLDAEMDQEAGAALTRYNYESAAFPWMFGCLGPVE